MHIFTKAVTRILLLSLIIGLTNIYSIAQNNSAKPTATVVTKKKTVGFKVKGTVTEASSGKGLAGINISVPGFSAAITDNKGAFTIEVPEKSTALMISGPGYQEREVALKGRKNVTVSLYEDTFQSVYDQARLPYGNVPMNQTNGAITSFNTDGNWQRSTETPDTYLQGKVAGLNVIRRSGTPSIGADLFLRGFTSLHATNQPLIVVDGVIYDVNSYGNSLITGHATNPLADIELNDIDNVTVVKDGTSSYGTRAANGVIFITTARAKDVATKIDFAAYGGFNSVPGEIPVMKAADYRTYLSDLLKTGKMTDDQIRALPFMNDDKTNVNYFRNHNETDWQKQVMKNSFNQNYQLKITGGDDIATYALSVGYTGNKGIISNTSLSRYFTRFNADLKLSKRLTANATLAFTSSQQQLKDQGINTISNPLYLGLVKAPIFPVNSIGDDGSVSPNLAGTDYFGVSNPTAVIQNVQDLNKNYRFSGNLGLTYQLAKHLKVSSLVGVTFDKVRETFFIPSNGVTHDTLNLAIANNRSGSNVQRLYSLYNDTRLSYTNTFDYIHELSVNLGERFNSSTSSDDYGLGYNSATDNFVSVGNGSNLLRQVGGDNGDWNWLDMYLNADYKLLSKYFFSFNTAIDGSSRFGTQSVPNANTIIYNGYTYSFLPSFAAGWLISSEKFMSNVKFIDMLKLRASYGLVGNDDIGNYTAQQYYVSQNLLGVEGLVRGNIANPALKWETVTKSNIGLDVALFNERLSFSLDVFNNRTTNMITYEPINTASGFSYAITNNGEMKTSGIELAVNGRIINSDVKWDMGLTLSHSKNKVTRIPGNQMVTQYANASYLTQVGSEANLFYGYKTNGIYKTNAEAATAGLSTRNASGNLVPFQGGDVKFVDVNGDKVIDNKDMQVIGNPNPDFSGSISNNISWKRFSFDALITFSKGNDIYNYTRNMLEAMSGVQNQTLDVNNRWRADGQITNMPRAVLGDPTGNSRFSDRWIEDGSYIRLRTISLTYDYPIKSGIMVKYIKIYATGNNVLTLTKYLGYDPEMSASGSIFAQGIDLGLEPQFRTVQLGVRIGL